MPRLLLHIGHPKTGTTALQSVFSANANTLLAEASVLYPTHTTPKDCKHSFAIPWLFKADNDAIRRRSKLSGEPLKEMSRRYWRSLSLEIKQTQHDISIISAEGFWSIVRHASAEQKAFVRQALFEIADEVSVVAYLRSPSSYFLSKLNQKYRSFKSVALPRPDYLTGAMQAWESLGLDNYSWRIFDRNYLDGQDVVADFCVNYLPNSFEKASLVRGGVERANSSISSEALVILEEIMAAPSFLKGKICERNRHRIVKLLNQQDEAIGGKTRPSLKESALKVILSHSVDLPRLEERGITFPDVDREWIRLKPHEDLPKAFTCVSDFCPVDTSRLAELREQAAKSIDVMLRPSSKVLFWPFQR